ncbi:hypothetical protein WA026_013303 [Henosepilachna vigintioctopunctata]|uniref:GDP-fucose protein O-fucosyltransferase 2 n=1 Tax=Henosepilachna vigintioctopunctata TaxID=420089 RepID=A0AAW1V8E4_9CUCU
MRFFEYAIFVLAVLIQCGKSYGSQDAGGVCFKDGQCPGKESPNRYIFFEINPSEGFNLRRDVYRRFAVLAQQLAASDNPKLKNFKLVLAPWSHLYHWTYSYKAEMIPWSYFFDIPSLKSFSPVIEMHEFFQEQSNGLHEILIDEVYVMQNWEEMMTTGYFVNKWQVVECEEEDEISYFYYTNVTSNNVKCLKFHGPSTYLTELLLKSRANTILFTHAEVALHPTFGDSLYWACRRSIRYNKDLVAVATYFRNSQLASTNKADNIVVPERWQDEKPKNDAIGGPYLAVHMRRRDFFIGRPKELPTIESVAGQIAHYLQKFGLSVVFLATDAEDEDVAALKHYLPKNVYLSRFIPEKRFVDHYKDGGTAIVDQMICSHARFFIGTAESTFTFRIFEDREILGFPSENTFNVLCVDESNCKKPSVWKIVY